MMAITGIDHVQVAVPSGSEARYRAFYVALLGMAELEKPAVLAARGGIWVRAGSHELHCGVEQDFRPARKAHPAFVVDTLDDLAERVTSAGHEVAWDHTNPTVRRFFTHDPFGNRLEFVSATDQSTARTSVSDHPHALSDRETRKKSP